MLPSSPFVMPSRLQTIHRAFMSSKLAFRHGLLAALCVALVGLLPVASHANTPSPNSMQLVGEGTLRWLGLKIYDAKLFTSNASAETDLFRQPFALELIYARSLDGQKIAERSLEEIQKLGIGKPEQHQRWLAQMIQIFPNVKEGDKIRGIYTPEKSAIFLLNDQPIGRVDDAVFAKAFFAIWLDPKTSEPKLRQSLLGPLLSRR
jgi:hypothetical protein